MRPGGVPVRADDPQGPGSAQPVGTAEQVERGVPGVPPELARYRATIDNLDAALVHLLAERFRCTQLVGHLKAELDLPPSDPGRERRQVARRRARAAATGRGTVFGGKVVACVGAEVIRHHEAIRDGQDH